MVDDMASTVLAGGKVVRGRDERLLCERQPIQQSLAACESRS